MIKKWQYGPKYTNFSYSDLEENPEFGCCYVAKIPVLQGFSLLKIGATRMPKMRFTNIGKKGTIFCMSPPHLNFWQNEEILHKHFQDCRVPPRPGRGVRGEFFNISLKYFFENLPDIKYETNKANLSEIDLPHYGIMYVTK